MVNLKIDGKDIPMVNLLPLEHQSKVIEICESVHRDYLPDLKNFLKELEGELTRNKITAYINAHNNNIQRHNGRTVIKELRFRLGIGGWTILEL